MKVVETKYPGISDDVNPDEPHGTNTACFLCNGNPPEAQYVDTLRNFDNGGVYSPFNGRKYVCSVCVTDLASALDIFAPQRAVYDEQSAAKDELIDALNSELAAYGNIKAGLHTLGINVTEPVEPVEAEVEAEKPAS